ncbi:unnamed protein product [Bursaphelenchus xylophilus]|uniref:(pine wood nematode) hypothetical protein n=1 Tax=Bursaphelenchus xylophilus TaxID=6326 RepID=A0A1I7S0R0_BURXY|nr:unnamed protein product [Bursaphelenchus xylophilus]CAG9088275.1 unnamed protein product [Bursaphelenchus xylophilus]
MANKRNNSEQVILNRRLKPIYDAVDNGNNKKAIQEADKLLKKHPDTYTAKGLKALALIRLERSAEAWPLVETCDEYIRNGNFDENTIQVVMHCYKEAYVPSRITLLLEEVNKMFPGNENLLIDLFTSYARIKDFKNQQRIAQLLSRDFSKPQYVFWTISSVVMQALKNPTMGPKVLYPLAQKMIEKALSNIIAKPTRSEIFLYVQILEGQAKYQESYDYLKNQIEKGNLTVDEGKMLILQALEKSKQYEKLLSELEKYAETVPYDLQIWQELFKLLGTVKDDEKLRSLTQQATVRMIKKVEEKVDKKYEKHSLLIIKCMYLKKLQTLDLSDNAEGLGSVLENAKSLIETSLDKPYCFKEMAQFLVLLKDNEQEDLLSYLKANVGVDTDKLTYGTMLYHLLRCSFGHIERDSIEERRKMSADLVGKLQNLENEDNYLGMAVSLVISNALWSAHLEEKSGPELLQELLVYLEWIYSVYSNSYITGLLLVRINAVLDNHLRVEKLLRQLDVKYIQRDSLAYLNFGIAESSGLFKEAILNYTTMTAFADQNDREIASSIVAAYKAGSVDQIASLVEFAKNCDDSLYLTAADVSNRLISSCHAVESLEIAILTLQGDEPKIEWDNLKDTRDFNVLNSMALYNQDITEKVRQITYQETRDFVELRHYLCKVVSNIGWNEAPLENVKNDLNALKIKLKECQSKYKISEATRYLQGFLEPVLPLIVNGPYLDPIINIAEAALKISEVQESNKNVEETVDDLRKALETLNLAKLVPEGSLIIKSSSQAITTLSLVELTLKFVGAKLDRVLGDKSAAIKKSSTEALKTAHDEVYKTCSAVEKLLQERKENGYEAMVNSEHFEKLNLKSQLEEVETSWKQSFLASIQHLCQFSTRVRQFMAQLKLTQTKI